MTAPQHGISPEFAAGLREFMLQAMASDFEHTKKVLAAVPDGHSDYRPDPKARTAANFPGILRLATCRCLRKSPI
jgi:hypothetical protein